LSALTRGFRNEPPPATLEEKSAHHLQAEYLRKAVQALNVTDQQIVYLRYFLDLSVTETADALNIAQGTVKSRLSRALEKLRTIIREDFPVLSEGLEV
jgi:RNA polymerase sigma-70 factor (ECF subfamily)